MTTPLSRESAAGSLRRSRLFRAAFALVAAACALFVVGRRVDWEVTRAELSRVGYRAPWVAVPYFFVLLLDTIGWQVTFEPKPPLWTLFRIRIATEAVSSSLPAGVAFGESLRVVLVSRETGLTGTAASANAIVTKVAIALAQGVFVVSAVMGALPRGDARTDGRLASAFPFLITVAAFGIVVAAMRFLARARPLGRVARALRSVIGSARRSLETVTRVADDVDDGLASFAGLPWQRQTVALAWFLLGWVALAGEDWTVLRLLTPSFSMSAAARMEGLVSLVRIGFFFLPGAIGAQEVSYFALIQSSHVADAAGVAAAFVVIKRVKELLWIGIGYALLAIGPSAKRPRALHESATPDALAPSKPAERLAADRQSGSPLPKGRSR